MRDSKRRKPSNAPTITKAPRLTIKRSSTSQENDGAFGRGRGYDSGQDAQYGGAKSKPRHFPVVGSFKPPPMPTRSPLRALKSTNNQNIQNHHHADSTADKPKNAPAQVKNTITYAENHKGELEIIKYKNKRTGSVIAVLPDASDASSEVVDQQGRYRHQVQAEYQESDDNQYHEIYRVYPNEHKYSKELRHLFKRDLRDWETQQHLVKLTGRERENHGIDPRKLAMENPYSDIYLEGPPPPASPTNMEDVGFPTTPQNQQQRAVEPQPGQEHASPRDLIRRGNDMGLASRSRINPFAPTFMAGNGSNNANNGAASGLSMNNYNNGAGNGNNSANNYNNNGAASGAAEKGKKSKGVSFCVPSYIIDRLLILLTGKAKAKASAEPKTPEQNQTAQQANKVAEWGIHRMQHEQPSQHGVPNFVDMMNDERTPERYTNSVDGGDIAQQQQQQQQFLEMAWVDGAEAAAMGSAPFAEAQNAYNLPVYGVFTPALHGSHEQLQTAMNGDLSNSFAEDVQGGQGQYIQQPWMAGDESMSPRPFETAQTQYNWGYDADAMNQSGQSAQYGHHREGQQLSGYTAGLSPQPHYGDSDELYSTNPFATGDADAQFNDDGHPFAQHLGPISYDGVHLSPLSFPMVTPNHNANAQNAFRQTYRQGQPESGIGAGPLTYDGHGFTYGGRVPFVSQGINEDVTGSFNKYNTISDVRHNLEEIMAKQHQYNGQMKANFSPQRGPMSCQVASYSSQSQMPFHGQFLNNNYNATQHLHYGQPMFEEARDSQHFDYMHLPLTPLPSQIPLIYQQLQQGSSSPIPPHEKWRGTENHSDDGDNYAQLMFEQQTHGQHPNHEPHDASLRQIPMSQWSPQYGSRSPVPSFTDQSINSNFGGPSTPVWTENPRLEDSYWTEGSSHVSGFTEQAMTKDAGNQVFVPAHPLENLAANFNTHKNAADVLDDLRQSSSTARYQNGTISGVRLAQEEQEMALARLQQADETRRKAKGKSNASKPNAFQQPEYSEKFARAAKHGAKLAAIYHLEDIVVERADEKEQQRQAALADKKPVRAPRLVVNSMSPPPPVMKIPTIPRLDHMFNDARLHVPAGPSIGQSIQSTAYIGQARVVTITNPGKARVVSVTKPGATLPSRRNTKNNGGEAVSNTPLVNALPPLSAIKNMPAAIGYAATKKVLKSFGQLGKNNQKPQPQPEQASHAQDRDEDWVWMTNFTAKEESQNANPHLDTPRRGSSRMDELDDADYNEARLAYNRQAMITENQASTVRDAGNQNLSQVEGTMDLHANEFLSVEEAVSEPLGTAAWQWRLENQFSRDKQPTVEDNDSDVEMGGVNDSRED